MLNLEDNIELIVELKALSHPWHINQKEYRDQLIYDLYKIRDGGPKQGFTIFLLNRYEKTAPTTNENCFQAIKRYIKESNKEDWHASIFTKADDIESSYNSMIKETQIQFNKITTWFPEKLLGEYYGLRVSLLAAVEEVVH